MIIQLLSIILWTVIIPIGMGLVIKNFIKDEKSGLLATWVYGLIFFLAIFQVITVTNLLTVNYFPTVCTYVIIITVIVAIAGIIVEAVSYYKSKNGKKIVVKQKNNGSFDKIEVILWCIFGATLLFQLIQVLRLAYGDGDDAYYVATSTYAVTIKEMYSQIPYTGAPSNFDTRHCLAPFPLWISFLARQSGMKSCMLAHTVMQLLLIPVSYIVFAMVGSKLIKDKKELPIFMIFMGIIQIFGNYSFYTAETFLLTRTRQGKAALASIVIPFAVFLMLSVFQRLKEEKRVPVGIWMLILLDGIVASLCSTIGNMLFPVLIVLTAIVLLFSYKKWKETIFTLCCLIPSIVMLLLYLKIN